MKDFNTIQLRDIGKAVVECAAGLLTKKAKEEPFIDTRKEEADDIATQVEDVATGHGAILERLTEIDVERQGLDSEARELRTKMADLVGTLSGCSDGVRSIRFDDDSDDDVELDCDEVEVGQAMVQELDAVRYRVVEA